MRVIISVALVVVFVAFVEYVWRMLRRAQQLLGMVKLQIRGTYNNSVADIAMDAGRAMQRRVERTVVVVFLTSPVDRLPRLCAPVKPAYAVCRMNGAARIPLSVHPVQVPWMVRFCTVCVPDQVCEMVRNARSAA